SSRIPRPSSALAIVGVLTELALIMALHEFPADLRWGTLTQQRGVISLRGHILEHYGVVQSIQRRVTPHEWAVEAHKCGSHDLRIAIAERLHDHLTSLLFVVVAQLLGAHEASARHRTGEVVRVGGAIARDVAAQLGPHRRVGSVCVHHSPDAREVALELKMNWQVSAGPQRSL